MTKHTQHSHNTVRRSINKTPLVAILAIALASPLGQVLAAEGAPSSYDENVLFNPSKGTLLAEARGRVFIYDGLEESVVEQALDNQFERIDNMMFVRTRHTLADGSVEVEDDCD